MSDFVHLHVHGEHSLLDGLTKANDAAQAALNDGQPGIALTDHGNPAGVMKMAQAAHKHGLAFWPGMELYLSIGDRHERNFIEVPREEDFDGSDVTAGGTRKKFYEHLTVLAGNHAGWLNLLVLNNKSHDSFYVKPRVDYDLLAAHSDGLTVGTGCLGGPVAGQLLQGNPEQAEVNLRRLVDIFGSRVFVEVMDHGIPAERRIVTELVGLAKRFGLMVVATNDAHYAHAHDAAHHDAWLCVAQSKGGRAKVVSDPDRWSFNGQGYHLKTAAEMHRMFDDQPGTELAVSNSLRVVEGFDHNVVIESIPESVILPNYQVPEGHTLDSYYHERIRVGLIERYGSPLPQTVRDRARYEEEVIRSFGVQGYFLVIADVIAAERQAGGLVGSGRGSGPGSIHAYALGISNIDPLRRGLLFERFLNPTRRGLPDFDTDFQASRQDAVIAAVGDTYGADRVARIGTYGQSWAKQSIKQMGRVLELTDLSYELAAAVPAGDAKRNSLARLLDPTNDDGKALRDAIDKHGVAAEKLIRHAQTIEGSASNETIHACGVVIADRPLERIVPLRRATHTPDSIAVTEWDADGCEAAKLVKFDFLAIKDLDVCRRALDMIEQTTGEQVDFYGLDADSNDERSVAAKEMLAAGRTAGVFQLGSKGITELTRSIRPDCAEDLSAILALYRPGPMGADQHNLYARRRRGGEPVNYDVFTKVPTEAEVIDQSLGSTLAAISFQEQLMQLARDIADFAPGQMADLQKAFSKKKQDMMDSLKAVWMSGGQAEVRADGSSKVSFRVDTLERLWRAFEASGEYLFNKSHAAAYAQLTWQMAYLKANWPSHFGAALLAVAERSAKRRAILVDLMNEGIEVLPPSVQLGRSETSVTDSGAIVLGLAEVRGVGSVAESIVQARTEGGRFKTLDDLVRRTKINSGAVQALAEAGALDEFGPRLGIAMTAKAAGLSNVAIPNFEWGILERSARQRQRIGIYLGPDPVEELRPKIRNSSQIAAAKRGEFEVLAPWQTPDFRRERVIHAVHNLPTTPTRQVNAVGIVASVDEVQGGKGKRLTFTLESTKDSIEVVMWPDRYKSFLGENRPPSVGDLVGVTGSIRIYIPVHDEEIEEQAEPVRSMVADNIWRIAVSDEPRRVGEEPVPPRLRCADRSEQPCAAPSPRAVRPRPRQDVAPSSVQPDLFSSVPESATTLLADVDGLATFALAFPTVVGTPTRPQTKFISSWSFLERYVQGDRAEVNSWLLNASAGDQRTLVFPALRMALNITITTEHVDVSQRGEISRYLRLARSQLGQAA